MSESGRKKWFPVARKSFFISRNKVIFHKSDFPLAEEISLNKRILF